MTRDRAALDSERTSLDASRRRLDAEQDELAKRQAALARAEREFLLARVSTDARESRTAEARNYVELVELVESRAAEFPEHEESWRTYLLYLRDHVQPDGSLPPAFEGLVWEVFGPILES